MKKGLKYLFIFNLLITTITSNYIVLPFKTLYKEEPKEFTNSTELINYWDKNLIYSTVKIGTPPQNIAIFFHSQNFGSYLYYHMGDFPDSNFERKESSSFVWKENLNKVTPMENASLVTDTFYFYDKLDTNEMKSVELIPFVYSDNDKEIQGKNYEYHNYTCMNIGLKLHYYVDHEKKSNFIEHLKALNNIILTYDYTLEYLSNDEGRIIIGEEPYTYAPDIYKKQNFKLSGAVYEKDIYNFYLVCDSIYMNINGKKEEIDTKYAKIIIDKGLIYGNEAYHNKIKQLFFDKMIDDKKCHCMDEDKNIVYFCDKKLVENEIKNFPTLYLDMKLFNKVFELTYKDLFREKNGKLYFLVYFKLYSYHDYFEIGKIFLKKYTLTFNQNNKHIGYITKEGESEEDTLPFYKKTYFWNIIGAIAIILAIAGFFGGKRIYDKVRKKRLNEVDDDNYDYEQPEDDKRLFNGSNFNVNDNE